MPPNIHKHCILQQRLVKKHGHCCLVGQTSPFLAWSFPIAFFALPFGLWGSGLLSHEKLRKWGSCSQEDTLQHSKKICKFQRHRTIQPCWRERHNWEVRFYYYSVYDSGCCADRSGGLLATRVDHSYNGTVNCTMGHSHVDTWLSNTQKNKQKKKTCRCTLLRMPHRQEAFIWICTQM